MASDQYQLSTRYQLFPSDASMAVEILLRLADLVDGGGDRLAQRHRLSEAQLELLSKPAGLYIQNPLELASRLRRISAQIETQLPPDAPAVRH